MKKIFTLFFSMRNILIVFFLAFTSLAPFAAYSQAALSTKIISFPDTASLKNTYNITVKVENTGNASCVADTAFYVYYATDSLLPPKLLGNISVAPPFNPGDTVVLIKPLTIDSARGFDGPGTYIVVVWATSNFCKTADSASKSTLVIDPLANVSGFYNPHGIKIYPNPVSSVLFAESHSFKNTVEGVRILDILGKIIVDMPATLTAPSGHGEETIKVNLPSLRSGMYILEIMDNRGQRHRTKFIKSVL